MSCTIGVAGLGVMGANLAMNFADRGIAVAGFDIDPRKAQALSSGAPAGAPITGVTSPADLASILETPRRILLMVPAGAAVDSAIETFRPHLQAGDVLIDGGNSHFLDTERRCRALDAAGLRFLGMGVSGGEEGARHGPSLMPGGPREAWEAVAPLFRAIAARAPDGEPCVEYMGPRGAGHYVKMVHNGIEYADMQLIAETYDLLHRGLGLQAPDLHALFSAWNAGELRSYLIEITAAVFAATDAHTGGPLVDVILDSAEQKGTGRWMSQNAFEIGAPIPTINAAVESRLVSALRGERHVASRLLGADAPRPAFSGDRQPLLDAARDALYASKVTAYAQGLAMLGMASREYEYDLRPGDIAKIWRAGCIIRADLLGDITDAYRRDPALVNLLVDPAFSDAVRAREGAWRTVVQAAVRLGIPMLATTSALSYFDAYRSERLPANLTQAQRDYFGAHTYRRVDRPGVFHAEWPSRPQAEPVREQALS